MTNPYETAERTSYTVERVGACVLIHGAVPAQDMLVLTKLVPWGASLSIACAKVWQATMAFGPAADLELLRQAGEADALWRARRAYPELSSEAVHWLASGERGVSSETIFSTLTGVDTLGGTQPRPPSDPSEWRRCQLLLEAVPELAPRLHEMAAVSPKWAELVESWPRIMAAMDEEVPGWRGAMARGFANRAWQIMRGAA
jgi:hypothetical protein